MPTIDIGVKSRTLGAPAGGAALPVWDRHWPARGGCLAGAAEAAEAAASSAGRRPPCSDRGSTWRRHPLPPHAAATGNLLHEEQYLLVFDKD